MNLAQATDNMKDMSEMWNQSRCVENGGQRSVFMIVMKRIKDKEHLNRAESGEEIHEVLIGKGALAQT